YREDPAKCCQLRKVEPLMESLEPFEIWFTDCGASSRHPAAAAETPIAVHGWKDSSETGRSAPSKHCSRACPSHRSFPTTHPMTATRAIRCGHPSIQTLAER